MAYYGYERVSTGKQGFDRQDEALKQWSSDNGVIYDKVFSDTVTGKTFFRDAYQKMKEILQPGDYVVIKEIDRLGRDWDGIKEEWAWMDKHDINVIIIDMPMMNSMYKDGATLDMRFMRSVIFELMCYLAEREREKISQRTKEALAAKKSAGKTLGRPVDEKRRKKICKLYLSGMSIVDISKQMDVARGTVYSAIKEAGLEIKKDRRKETKGS
ncbi:recombinase family protein [Holdemania sp. Marseille-P2844]|jgi:DNA invertase Pin-like site-specific DNA recombinase|uniref:recombinase family protein n=1 Tax=Holdemania sp. Marseille-P2844 TaxID=1852366 RepID=UPI0009324B4F|nr:recombinase family protein [Holdemania sp. Marseille-P2844]